MRVVGEVRVFRQDQRVPQCPEGRMEHWNLRLFRTFPFLRHRVLLHVHNRGSGMSLARASDAARRLSFRGPTYSSLQHNDNRTWKEMMMQVRKCNTTTQWWTSRHGTCGVPLFAF